MVFVAVQDEEGKFVRRTVTLGPPTGELYTVRQGLQPGEVVVTKEPLMKGTVIASVCLLVLVLRGASIVMGGQMPMSG